jgi:hypothetical protein
MKFCDIQRELQAVLDRVKEKYFHEAFDAWKKKQWDCCIHSQEDYFEGNGSQINQHFFFGLVQELSDRPSYCCPHC